MICMKINHKTYLTKNLIKDEVNKLSANKIMSYYQRAFF